MTSRTYTARVGILTGDLLTAGHTERPLTVWRMSPRIDPPPLSACVCVASFPLLYLWVTQWGTFFLFFLKTTVTAGGLLPCMCMRPSCSCQFDLWHRVDIFLSFSFKRTSSPKIEIQIIFLQSHSELCLVAILSNCKPRDEHWVNLYLEKLVGLLLFVRANR